VGTWAARTSRGTWAQGRENTGHAIRQLEYSAALDVLLVIGGVEQILGPDVEAENIVQPSATRVNAVFTTAVEA
jgi:hypothetical protein